MIRHKYVIKAQLDYSSILGDSIKELFNNELYIIGTSTEIVSLTSLRQLYETEQQEILKVYKDSFAKFELPDGGKLIVNQIEYVGTVDVPQDEPDEINLFEKF